MILNKIFIFSYLIIDGTLKGGGGQHPLSSHNCRQQAQGFLQRLLPEVALGGKPEGLQVSWLQAGQTEQLSVGRETRIASLWW